MLRPHLALVSLWAVLVAAGCAPRGGAAHEAPARTATPEPAPAAPAPSPDPTTAAPASAPALQPAPPPPAVPPSQAAPARVERLPVEGDLPASIVRGADGKPPRIVFLPGVCSNGGAYLYAFPEAARASGGVVAIEGDRPCGGSTQFRSITSDPAHEEPRIERALRAAGTDVAEDTKIVLVGYSLGATLAENLVRMRPSRYERVVLIGSPRDPVPARLKSARAVATMSCSLDVPQRMRSAVKTLGAAGVTARYFELPGCTHGNVTDGDRVLGEALAWLSGN